MDNTHSPATIPHGPAGGIVPHPDTSISHLESWIRHLRCVLRDCRDVDSLRVVRADLAMARATLTALRAEA
jgi:hypothetical protein